MEQQFIELGVVKGEGWQNQRIRICIGDKIVDLDANGTNALRAALKDTDVIAEAEVEHQSAKDLIAQIEGMGEADEMFDAKVTVLGEYIDHHVKEERNEIFPKARAVRKLDLVGMRDELMARKEELMGETA